VRVERLAVQVLHRRDRLERRALAHVAHAQPQGEALAALHEAVAVALPVVAHLDAVGEARSRQGADLDRRRRVHAERTAIREEVHPHVVVARLDRARDLQRQRPLARLAGRDAAEDELLVVEAAVRRARDAVEAVEGLVAVVADRDAQRDLVTRADRPLGRGDRRDVQARRLGGEAVRTRRRAPVDPQRRQLLADGAVFVRRQVREQLARDAQHRGAVRRGRPRE